MTEIICGEKDLHEHAVCSEKWKGGTDFADGFVVAALLHISVCLVIFTYNLGP